MSSKSAFKGNLKSTKPPRELEELKKIAGQLTFELGNAQYQAAIHLKEANRLVEALEAVNTEAAARNELDKKAEVPA